MVCAANWPKNKFCAVIGSLARSGLAVRNSAWNWAEFQILTNR